MHLTPAGWVNDVPMETEQRVIISLISDQNNSQHPSVAAPQTETAQPMLTK